MLVHVTCQAAWHTLPKTPNFPMGKAKTVGSGFQIDFALWNKKIPFSILLLTTWSVFTLTSSLCGDHETQCQYFAVQNLPDTIISDNRSAFATVKIWYLWTRILSQLSSLHLICFLKKCLGWRVMQIPKMPWSGFFKDTNQQIVASFFDWHTEVLTKEFWSCWTLDRLSFLTYPVLIFFNHSLLSLVISLLVFSSDLASSRDCHVCEVTERPVVFSPQHSLPTL